MTTLRDQLIALLDLPHRFDQQSRTLSQLRADHETLKTRVAGLTVPATPPVQQPVPGTVPPPARPAPSTASAFLAGVNLAGLEFGHQKTMPGQHGRDYVAPTAQEVAYFAGKGMTIVRLPFSWERVQRGLRSDLHTPDLDHLRAVADAAGRHGMTVILDCHNYARWKSGDTEHVLGTPGLPVDALADLWRRLALEFKGQPHVWFGLMNEPHDLPTRQ